MLKRTIDSLFISRRKELPFIVLAGFLITFLLTRMWIYTIYNNGWEHYFFLFVWVDGVEYHVHHLSYGIIGMSLLGFLAIAFPKAIERMPHISATLYGLFLALIFDEAALWMLDLDIPYTHRFSIDAVIITVTILLLFVYSPAFCKWLTKYIKKLRSQQELPIDYSTHEEKSA